MLEPPLSVLLKLMKRVEVGSSAQWGGTPETPGCGVIIRTTKVTF